MPAGAPGDDVAERIRDSGLTHLDPIDPDSPLFFDILVLEERLNRLLVGRSLDYAIKSRSKYIKSWIAEAMGYPIPSSFRRTQPRFRGQNLDIYVQKANNFQIWNEEIDPQRRYAFIRVDKNSVITRVHLVTGEDIALLDHTGTLTQKYQANRRSGFTGSKLVSAYDTDPFIAAFRPTTIARPTAGASPAARPVLGQVMSIVQIFASLTPLVGQSLPSVGRDQERNRGAHLHRMVCHALGYDNYADTGQFPDVLGQALEVKLQTSRTIDLGLISPRSEEPAQAIGPGIRHCDVRYAVFYGSLETAESVRLEAVVVTTGAQFFEEFQQFEGLVSNKKLQIRLPSAWFD